MIIGRIQVLGQHLDTAEGGGVFLAHRERARLAQVGRRDMAVSSRPERQEGKSPSGDGCQRRTKIGVVGGKKRVNMIEAAEKGPRLDQSYRRYEQVAGLAAINRMGVNRA